MAKGKKVYDKFLASPKWTFGDLRFEPMLSIVRQAFEKKTGKDLDFETAVSIESFSNEAGWVATKQTKPGWATGKGVPPGNRRPG